MRTCHDCGKFVHRSQIVASTLPRFVPRAERILAIWLTVRIAPVFGILILTWPWSAGRVQVTKTCVSLEGERFIVGLLRVVEGCIFVGLAKFGFGVSSPGVAGVVGS